MTANNKVIYYEEVSSKRTGRLFCSLAILSFLLLIWRVKVNGVRGMTIVFLFFFCFFLFYSLNYRTLILRISSGSLKLVFGIFTWIVLFDDMESCSVDEIPALLKYGGAGIHFMYVRKRYRVSFNFLEHPRVLISLSRKAGLVQDISFTTLHPEEVLQVIQEAKSARPLV